MFVESQADGANSVFTADVDGDGDVDVLSASRNDDKVAWYEQLETVAGDANQDFQFDQLDIVEVLQSGKYLTGKPTTWS